MRDDDRETIHTDGQGRPFERLEKPPADASIEEKIAFMDALCASNDAIAACRNKAFDKAFRKALREP
jgi:hypothetical protein